MTDKDPSSRHFRSAVEDRDILRKGPQTPQTCSRSYGLAFDDSEFLLRDDLRPVRLQLELMKAQMVFEDEGIDSTVVIFGGARIPAPGATPVRTKNPQLIKNLQNKAHFYDEARHFAQKVSRHSLETGGREWVICSGGGPGVMEAANRGASDVGAKSIGLNIVLPHEQAPNAYITPELSLQFHYFAIRKMQFLMQAKALAVFPGGFGTLDETFETLTLIQTGRVAPLPVLLFGEAFWRRIINFEALADEGTIAPEDLELFSFVETAEEGWAKIREFYQF
jgi:uncharacterized protein (TIGR00730 family)